MSQPVIILKPHRLNRIHRLFPELYRNDFYQIRGNPQAGDLVRLIADDGDFAGIGYFNPKSQTIVHVLTIQDEPIDRDFFARKLEQAFRRREGLSADSNTVRLFHGFADGLPGLFIDRVEETLILQATTYYMDQQRDLLGQLAAERTGASRALYLSRKDDSEMLKDAVFPLLGNLPERLPIQEGAFRWEVAPGELYRSFFPDEREIRRAVARLTQPARAVLDLFAGIGTLECAVSSNGSGKEIVAVEPGESVVHQARQFCQQKLDGAPVEWIADDPLEALYRLQEQGKQFDVVLIHPPFQTRDVREYKRIKWRYWYYVFHALPLLRPGGHLLVSTRSAHFSQDNLVQTVAQAASGRGLPIYLRETLTPPPDYPYLLQYPKTFYLKAVVCQI
jgi:23S rRNA (cytosine1962-C5)-methyltransferase